jgi:hypothetical protein
MAGVNRPDDIEMVTAWLREHFPDPHTALYIHSDAGINHPAVAIVLLLWALLIAYNNVHCRCMVIVVTALASGTQGKLHGIVLISGTGTIAMGYKDINTTARAAGWGPLLGDIGSGYWISMQALSAITKHEVWHCSSTLPPLSLYSHMPSNFVRVCVCVCVVFVGQRLVVGWPWS